MDTNEPDKCKLKQKDAKLPQSWGKKNNSKRQNGSQEMQTPLKTPEPAERRKNVHLEKQICHKNMELAKK